MPEVIKLSTRKGVVVEIDGQPLQVPPLTLGALRSLTREGVFETIAKAADAEPSPAQNVAMIDAWIAIVSAAFSVTDPAFTKEFVQSWPLTIADLMHLVNAIMAASGMVAEKGEASPGLTASP